jgi:hypothetical protein
MELTLNFEKTFISQSVGIILQENLQHRDVETLNRILQGKKAQYQDANSLICSVLKALVNANEREETEFVTTGGEDKEGEHSQGVPEQGNLQSQLESSTSTDAETAGGKISSRGVTDTKTPAKNKKKELCRFYARGRCNRNRDCRFGHPDLCKKFKLFGSKSTDPKGCDGKCNLFHPNACRNSLLSRTCSFKDCRFFHLKGTRLSDPDLSGNGRQDRDWNTQQNNPWTNRPNPLRAKPESKNWQRHNPDQNLNPQAGNAPQEDPALRNEEKHQLNQTLEAIMKRLSAMEARSSMYLQPTMNLHQPALPIPSPTVQQPGSQTQMQWGSPNQWTQTQY